MPRCAGAMITDWNRIQIKRAAHVEKKIGLWSDAYNLTKLIM